MRSQHGRTFLEVIIVVSVSSILAAAAIHRYTGNAKTVQAESAEKIILADLRYAHEMAMITGRTVEVVINPANNRYTIRYQDTGELLRRPRGTGNVMLQLGEGKFKGVTITQTHFTQGSLLFKPDGSPAQGGQNLQSKKLVLQTSMNKKFYVMPGTGEIITE